MKPRVLVADDDAGVRYTLREVLSTHDVELVECADGVEALARVTAERFDLVLTDLRMPGLDGIELLRRMRALATAPPVVMLTAHGSERHAVEAMKLGAMDYFAKPFDIDHVLRVTERALASARVRVENEVLRAELKLARHMVVASEAMRRVALMVTRVAPLDVTVLLTGPSGTGKERVAEALVACSSRAAGPFVRCNCAALPRELAEAELFGHARGAFTGAVRARQGLFREASGGTLLLDEVGELDPMVQGKLLRALQEGVVRPVGEDRDVKVAVRLLAATHRDLKREVARGAFREDLYYRLAVVELRLPPLSERREEAFERGLVVEELKRCGGNRSEAARRLGIARVSLHDRLKKYGVADE